MTCTQRVVPDHGANVEHGDFHECLSVDSHDFGDVKVLKLLRDIQGLQDQLRDEHVRTTHALRSENALLRSVASSGVDPIDGELESAPCSDEGVARWAGRHSMAGESSSLSSGVQEGLVPMQELRAARYGPHWHPQMAMPASASPDEKEPWCNVSCSDQFAVKALPLVIRAPHRHHRVFEHGALHSSSPPESEAECCSSFGTAVSEVAVGMYASDACCKKTEDAEDRRRVLRRVHERVFKDAPSRQKAINNVAPKVLHGALVSYGLVEYSLDQIDGLIKDICEAQMQCAPQEGNSPTPRTARAVRKRSSRVGPSRASIHSPGGGSDSNIFASARGKFNALMSRGTSDGIWNEDLDGIPFDHFGEAMFSSEVRRLMSADSGLALDIVKEVLISGNILKLVSDTTRLSVLELASPEPKVSILERIEPLVALLIISNGLLLGVQVDPAFESWGGWFLVEAAFVFMFCCELVLRIFSLGMQRFFLGPDMNWNMMDLTIVCISLIETALSQWMWSTNMFRLIRLTRLSRLLRVMRFRMFKELVLMLRGLIGGFRTLGWAMVLLLSAVYVIGLLMNSTLGQSERVNQLLGEEAVHYFSTVPGCMFLAFRCFIGDCSDSSGRSVLTLLATMYEIEFEVPFIMSTMLVNFGIFNLITALYIESTLEAAKQGASNPEQGHNQAVRIANNVKKMLQRMSYLYRLLQDAHRTGSTHMTLLAESGTSESRTWRGSIAATSHFDDCDENVEITKEHFLHMMMDPLVQKYLDELDVPVNRMHLFEVLDADGSGSLKFSELVQGILATRGEPKKSDTVACLLSVRNMQETVSSNHAEFMERFDVIQTQMRLALGNSTGGDQRRLSKASLSSSMEDDERSGSDAAADAFHSFGGNSSQDGDQCSERVEGTTPTTEMPSPGDVSEPMAAKKVLLSEGLISL